MAESLQKIDRLIEGQGQIAEIATRADQNANTAARGVANLTLSMQKQFDILRAGQDELRTGQDELRQKVAQIDVLKAGQDELRAGQDELRAGQDELQTGQEELQAGQDKLWASLNELRQQHNEFRQQVTSEFYHMNQKFDLVIELLRHR